MLKGRKIFLTGRKMGGFYGKSYPTGFDMKDFINLIFK